MLNLDRFLFHTCWLRLYEHWAYTSDWCFNQFFLLDSVLRTTRKAVAGTSTCWAFAMIFSARRHVHSLWSHPLTKCLHMGLALQLNTHSTFHYQFHKTTQTCYSTSCVFNHLQESHFDTSMDSIEHRPKPRLTDWTLRFRANMPWWCIQVWLLLLQA